MKSLLKKLRSAANDLYIYRHTRRAIGSAADRMEAVAAVWGAEEPEAYDVYIKERVSQEWPELATALDRMCK